MASSRSRWENLFTYETLVHACSGSVASITAMSVFYPLDTVRSRLQVEDNRQAKDILSMLEELVREEGPGSLYRGLEPVLVSLCASGFVYFYTFHGLRAVFSGKEHSAFRDLCLGALAGAVNVMTCTPFWVVNTRMKLQGAKLKSGDEKLNKYPKYTGIIDGLVKISSTEGPATLWSGALPSLVLISNPALQFMVYESMKRRVQQLLGTQQIGSTLIFTLGAIAKSISTIITYPLQVVQQKLRYGSDDVKNKSMIEILMMIVKRNGVANGLYKGMETKLLQTVLTTALMFLCYENIVAFVFRIMKGKSKLG